MTKASPVMVLQHLSSAQQLLNLAHTQAQQMLSLAYQQAQQVLTCSQSQGPKPPSLVSKCKAHHRPACPLAPCTQVLFNRSKVTCKKLHAELVKNSRHSKDRVTSVNTNHPARTKPSCTTQALKSDSCSPAQIFPHAKKSKLPRPIKRFSGSTHTSLLGCGSRMGEGKHPNKPTCVIKALRTSALLPRFSELKQTLASLENVFVPQQQATPNTHASTCSDAVPSVVALDVKLPSAVSSLLLSSAPLSTKSSSKVHTISHASASELTVPRDPAQVAWFDDDYTPSHLRHLNPPLSYGHLTHGALVSVGSVSQRPAQPTQSANLLLLEPFDAAATLTPALLQDAQDALCSQQWQHGLALLLCCLTASGSKSPSELVPLQRNCACLHLFYKQPYEAMQLCTSAQAVDPDDLLTAQLGVEAKEMILQQELGRPAKDFIIQLP